MRVAVGWCIGQDTMRGSLSFWGEEGGRVRVLEFRKTSPDRKNLLSGFMYPTSNPDRDTQP